MSPYHEELTGSKRTKRDLKDFTRAIARTIELNCTVLHDGNTSNQQKQGAEVYRDFWKNLFLLNGDRMDKLPTILSFNYDLVLERALFQAIVGHRDASFWSKRGISGIRFKYHRDDQEQIAYRMKTADFYDMSGSARGYILEKCGPLDTTDKYVEISYLKLHGSLNFSNSKSDPEWSPVRAQADPQIIPPVFNKANEAFASPIWRAALEALRSCKNLIICGYSLPITDTYMQYFLKAALGPNKTLGRIFVFDPVLFGEDPRGAALRARYNQCFSPQMQNRIEYTPPNIWQLPPPGGTFSHMVGMLEHDPNRLLFGLRPKSRSN